MKEERRVLAELQALRVAVEGIQKQISELKVERLTFTFEEAGTKIGRSPRTISRMVKRGELETVTISGSQMIPLDELQRITTPKPTRAVAARRGKPVTGGAAKVAIEKMLKRKR